MWNFLGKLLTWQVGVVSCLVGIYFYIASIVRSSGKIGWPVYCLLAIQVACLVYHLYRGYALEKVKI